MTTKLRKILTGVVAAAVLAGSAVTATTASAKPYQNWSGHPNYNHSYNHYNHGGRYYRGGWGWGYDNGIGAGILGFFAGAAVGSALSHSYDNNSCYRFKTYNPNTGMYMSYNGPRHCP
jgi:hypothetical protein